MLRNRRDPHRLALVLGLGGALAGLMMPATVATAAPACHPRAHPLPVISPGEGSVATDIDNVGLVVGFSRGRAVAWRNGRIIDVAPGVASAVNDGGSVVGSLDDGTHPSHAFQWQAGHLRLLPMTEGQESAAYTVNDVGDIGGYVGSQAVVWHNGTMKRIPLPPAADLGTVRSIDNVGKVALTFFDRHNRQRSAIWFRGKLTVLPIPDTALGVFATAVAASGRVGASLERPSNFRAAIWRGRNWTVLQSRSEIIGTDGGDRFVGDRFVAATTVAATWDSDNVSRLLPTLPGNELAEALGANLRGTAVGWNFSLADGDTPTVWTCAFE